MNVVTLLYLLHVAAVYEGLARSRPDHHRVFTKMQQADRLQTSGKREGRRTGGKETVSQ